MEMDDGEADTVRITLIGPSQTGKSTFASSVVTRSVSRSGAYHRTMKNVLRYVNLKPREAIGIHLEDTVGTNKIVGEAFDVARNQVFIVFFDWSRPETRKLALDMIAEIRVAETHSKRRPPRPIILLGNKRDIASQDQDRDMDRLKKAAYTGNFFLFSGSVRLNSFSLIEKPRRYEKQPLFFCRLFDIQGSDDFRIEYSALQLVENLRALFEDSCGMGFSAAIDKGETHPLIPNASIAKDSVESEPSWLKRICGCCFRD